LPALGRLPSFLPHGYDYARYKYRSRHHNPPGEKPIADRLCLDSQAVTEEDHSPTQDYTVKDCPQSPQALMSHKSFPSQRGIGYYGKFLNATGEWS